MKYKSIFFKGLALTLAGIGAYEASVGCELSTSMHYLIAALLAVVVDELICINGKFRSE